MPILFSINDDFEVFLSSYVGDITDSQLLLSYQQLFEGGRWRPGLNEIVDARNANSCGVTFDGLTKLSLLIERYTSGKCTEFKAAIIAPQSTVSGLAHFYQSISSDSLKNAVVFSNESEALKWIGVDSDEFELLQHGLSSGS